MKTRFLILVLVVLVLSACQAAPDPAVIAATVAAQTAAAASPTPPPSATSEPTATPVPPTATPVPPTATATLEPTQTPLPTATSTITPIPGPISIKDDFSAKSDIWGKCDKCEWRDGKLFFGPFGPNSGSDQVFPLVCEACGEHDYFRISADLTFAAGQAGDRTYGVGGVIPGKVYVGTGITPYQWAGIEGFEFATSNWFGSSFKRYSAVKAGTLTNHVEFVVKPDSGGDITYYANINGKTILFLGGQKNMALKPAIYLGWHSVGVSVDNFEFEEIEP